MTRKLIPLPYSPDMAAANIQDLKSQTRRTKGLNGLNEFANDWVIGKEYVSKKTGKLTFPFFDKTSEQRGQLTSPYGKPGDIIWMRENYGITAAGEILYYATDSGSDGFSIQKWKPNIHMPLSICRYFAEILEIRLERLHDITEEDAIAEGVERSPIANPKNMMVYKSYITGGYVLYPYTSYCTLWQSINGRNSWFANPWVWVIKYITLPSEFYPDLRNRNLDALPPFGFKKPYVLAKDSMENVMKGIAQP